MFDHKQPGKSTLTGHHGHGHGPTPGKRTLVEQHDRGNGHGFSNGVAAISLVLT